jgi:hypothetical protein
METGSKTFEVELLRSKRWAGLARDWDLARELDSCKQNRDSCQRQIGLMTIGTDQVNYDSLISQSKINQQRIDVIEEEIMKRKGRY